MQQIDPFISEITSYCERARISPSTLCVRVLGNSRFMDRLRRKLEKMDDDMKKLSVYMAENPPEKSQVSQ
ncbi:hypothetical protein [Pseudogemmobacter sonorensis]|uniref:hypothetical protein n=1 Tax=Pseudogemmobacter sonorensis TaxID=2989681 RepID=UPI0036CB0B0D